jgi:hypothetical protein
LKSLRRAYTEHLGSLASRTDLGASFVQGGKVVFLFGDTLAADDPALQDVDFSATAPLVMPASGVPPLSWGPALAPPGLPLGKMGVPTDGFAIDDDTYVFFATRFDEQRQIYLSSALARTKGLALDRLEVVHDVPAGDFANVSVILEGDEAFIFGTGSYRKSAIRMARVPVSSIANRRAWEIERAPVIDVTCAGEISARKHPTLPLYMIASASAEPRGIALHLAEHPAGPWEPAGLLYEPTDGYERFIHAKESAVGYDDGLSDPRQEETWGGEYGAYFVPEWFAEEGGAHGIVYTLSSWNPYRVHLMRTWLVPEGVTRERPKPERQAVAFTIHGRRGCARLRFGGAIVRESRAPGLLRTRRVRWNVADYPRDALQLELVDADARDLTWT